MSLQSTGHPGLSRNIGEDNPRAKLTAEDVKQIRALYAIGMTQKQIQVQCFPHVSANAIGQAAKRITWKHVE